jgi:hypothetical protein
MQDDPEVKRASKSVNTARPVFDGDLQAQSIKLRADSSDADDSRRTIEHGKVASESAPNVEQHRSTVESEPWQSGERQGFMEAAQSAAMTRVSESIDWADHTRTRGSQRNAAKPPSSATQAPDKSQGIASGTAQSTLGNPTTTENDWIPALIELSNQDKILGKPKPRRSLASTFVSLVLITGALGFGGWYVSMHAPADILGLKKEQFRKEQPDFAPYMANLQHEIKSHWHPPKGSETNHIKVHFKVNKNGEISGIGFDRLAPSAAADAAALKAVIESMGSAPPLPAGSPDSVDIQFTFDYNVLKH